MTVFNAFMHQLADLFLVPVLVLIVVKLAYAFVVLGAFAAEAWQRMRGTHRSALAAYHAASGAASDDLEVWIIKRLEWLRIVSRSAPLLGLIATLIPMGSALLALADNNAGAMGRDLAVAFSAVILALVSATITFTILTIRRRWLLQELRAIERARERVDALPA